MISSTHALGLTGIEIVCSFRQAATVCIDGQACVQGSLTGTSGKQVKPCVDEDTGCEGMRQNCFSLFFQHLAFSPFG